MLIFGLEEGSGVDLLALSLAVTISDVGDGLVSAPLDEPSADEGEGAEPASLANRLLRILSASEVVSDMVIEGDTFATARIRRNAGISRANRCQLPSHTHAHARHSEVCKR